jgi:hypothetical protein
VRALLLKMFGSVAVNRPWAVILCRFKGASPDLALEEPIEQFYRGAFTPGTGGLVEYWRDASLGAIDITGSRVFDWVEVDITRDKAGVPPTGPGRLGLAKAAIRAVLQRNGSNALEGLHGQIAVYMQNWTQDNSNRPPGTPNWTANDPVKPWWPFWIDGGSTVGEVAVTLTPPHNGNITAHEMGHVFDMNHDVGPDLMTSSDYSDPCCIMSQNGPLIHPTWRVNFGPSVCLPHLMQRDWMYKRRVYYDDGEWLSQPDGITLPLAPISRPIARANLGIRLAYTRDATNWDYYLEYVIPTEWNQGVPGAPLFFIRRIVSISGTGDRPAYLGFIKPPTTVGTTAEFVEPSGNVRFQVELTDLQGPILKVNAKKL